VNTLPPPTLDQAIAVIASVLDRQQKEIQVLIEVGMKIDERLRKLEAES